MNDVVREMVALAKKDFYSHKAKIVAVYAGTAAVIILKATAGIHHLPTNYQDDASMAVGCLQMVIGYGILVDNITMDCLWNRRGFLFLKPVGRRTLAASKIILMTFVGVIPVLATVMVGKNHSILTDPGRSVLAPFLRLELVYSTIAASAFFAARAGEAIGVHLVGAFLTAVLGARFIFASRFGPDSLALFLSACLAWGAVFLAIHIRSRAWAALAAFAVAAGGAVGLWTWS
jgi:hypothetical protein